MNRRSPHIPACFAGFIVLAFALSACLGEAEHSNPLDPNADDFEEVGPLFGKTTRYYPPFAAVENAEVRLSPGPFMASSDADGSFAFDGVPVGEYRLAAVKDGFASDTQTVYVELGASTGDVQVRMAGLPEIREVSLRTTRVSRWYPPDDLFLLEVRALVEDADGLSDLDRVWFEIPGHGYLRELSETAIAGRYAASLPADSLPADNLFALQGAEMRVGTRDDAGFQDTSGPYQLVRIIEYTPVALEPQGQQNVGTTTPTFIWEDAVLPYDYTYRLDIVRDQANVQTVVTTIDGISQDSTRYKVETPLASGTYFWTVSVVDSYGNRSRSREAGFIVPQ